MVETHRQLLEIAHRLRVDPKTRMAAVAPATKGGVPHEYALGGGGDRQPIVGTGSHAPSNGDEYQTRRIWRGLATANGNPRHEPDTIACFEPAADLPV